MENSKAQLLERLQSASNILVTVSSNPTVDQLSAAIGLTLMLNKIGKQGTAVFSGKVPSTIEFLQPEKTIEKNTDSLRDFIIALDKSKADKLRYKVEDNHVKIFITPYKTAISEKDLQFSQGDFNVEVVVALGVKDQKDLDRAITAHGRILHDATTISVTNGEPGTVGAIGWDDPKASSLSEMIASLAGDLGQNSLDGQIATAFMTGIVSMTERFRNARTSPATMSIGSSLMAAGANQQLIATKLEQAEQKPVKESAKADKTEAEPDTEPKGEQSPEPAQDPSALRIDHEEDQAAVFEMPADFEAVPTEPTDSQASKEEQSDPNVKPEDSDTTPEDTSTSDIVGGGSLVLEPPTLGGKLTANAEPEHLDPPIDALGVTDARPPILQRQEATVDVDDTAVLSDLPLPIANEAPVMPLPPTEVTPPQEQPAPVVEEPAPLQIELPQEVPQEQPKQMPDVSDARDAVSDALASISSAQPLPPISALNAQPFDINDQLGNTVEQPAAPAEPYFTPPGVEEADNVPVAQAPATPEFVMPENLVPPSQPPVDVTAAPVTDPTAPPSVPPPFMPNMPGFDPGATPPPAPDQNNNQQQPPASNPSNPFNLPPA